MPKYKPHDERLICYLSRREVRSRDGKFVLVRHPFQCCGEKAKGRECKLTAQPKPAIRIPRSEKAAYRRIMQAKGLT